MSAVPVIPPSPANTIACGLIFPIVSGAIVLLRFYCRSIQNAKLLIDDWLTIPAWFCMTGMGICLVIGVYKEAFAYPSPKPGPGQDPNTFTDPKIVWNRKFEWSLELMQFPALTCVKLSFLFFYQRIFCTRVTRLLNIFMWFLIVVCILWGIAFFFGFVFVCGTEITKFWGTNYDFKSHCSRVLTENYYLTITDFILDAIIFVIPIPLVWRLQLSPTRKFGLIAIFAVGAVTLAASITRLVVFVNAVVLLKKTYKSSGSNNLTVTAGLYWTVFETGIGLIVVCMPSIYVLLKRFSEKHFGLKTVDSKKLSYWPGNKSNSRSQHSHRTDISVSELELVHVDGPMVCIEANHPKRQTPSHNSHDQGDGITVSKTVEMV